MRLGNVTECVNAPVPAVAVPLPSNKLPFHSTSTCLANDAICELRSRWWLVVSGSGSWFNTPYGAGQHCSTHSPLARRRNGISTPQNMRDVNLELAGLLYDMAAIAGDSQRAWGYKRAAKAVLRVDRDITPLVTANTFKAIPGIGPTTDRIARELILDGRCSLVERAVRESGKEQEIARLHNLRRHYLSRAAVNEIVVSKGSPSRARYRGDFQM